MFDDKTPPRPETAPAPRAKAEDDPPRPTAKRGEAPKDAYHYTDWALI